ncbi:MAG: hypothetical protein EA419_01485 [Wenzhouxiangella sp.]|nr:MAG: hypothetical protein EA419_01485 [Wenzhouxiangella sp.]
MYAVYQVFSSVELIHALRWGVVAIIRVQFTVFLRGFMGMHFEANRVLREVKRLELRLVRMEERGH